MKTTTLPSRDSISGAACRLALLLIPLVGFACFALSPEARAVCQVGCDTSNDNTYLGDDALISNTSGDLNTAIGFEALFTNTTGNNNTAIGYDALLNNTTGSNNTAIGFFALAGNTTGVANTANGTYALSGNNTGSNNTANGFNALWLNTTGTDNTATGFEALLSNTTGSNNTANGNYALFRNTTGIDNTAGGLNALLNNTTGIFNTAEGTNALVANTTGNGNTADGLNALFHNTSGINNTAEGISALVNNSTGSSNISVGASAGSALTTGSSNIDIGNVGVAGEANTIRLGKVGTQQATFIAGISGKVVSGGVGVIVDSNGHLGTIVSSERFKDEVRPMDKASEAILSLEPVTFRYKHELDPDGIPQFGLVAEQVEKVNPELVARDDQGKAYTVRYEAVNAMLLNEFLKEHRKVEQQAAHMQSQDCKVQELEVTVAQQQKDFRAEIQALTARLNAQESQIGKVNDQLTLSKLAPQLVADSQ